MLWIHEHISKFGGVIMRKFSLILIAICSFAFASRAQDTNALKTEIGNFEARTGAVIVKGFGEIGSVTAGAATISVRCKESADAGSGRKEYGVAIAFAENQRSEISFVDYDEMDSLLAGIDYLSKITYSVTSLPSFEATYTTKSGLRIIAYSPRREGGIQTFLQYNDSPRIALTSDQMAQFESLIGQAKGSLDALRNAK
jgi:hypothetical protein